MTREYYTPAELVKQSPVITADLEEGQEIYDKNSKRSFMDGSIKPGFVILKGEASTDGIIESDWAIGEKSGKYYTLGIELSDEQDEAAFESLTELLADYVKQDLDMNAVNPCNKGKINLKMKFSGTKFDPRFNSVKVSTQSIEDINALIMLDTPLTVKAELYPSFTFDDQKAKWGLVVRSVEFPGELKITPIFKQPVSKKQKKE